MKKIFSLILVSLISLTFFACTPTVVREDDEDEPAFDVLDIIIRDGYSGNDFVKNKVGDYEHTDKLYELIDNLEETYGCSITFEVGDLDKLTSAFAVWEHYADLMTLRISHLYTAYASNFIVPLNQLSTLDLYNGKYGPQSLLDGLTWKDETVAFWPSYWGLPMPMFQDALMYNPRLVKEFGLQDPQELYEKDLWTWDTYKAMAKTVADSVNYDSAEEYPIWFSCLDHYTVRMALYGNGARPIEEDENGKYYLNITSAESRQAINWVNELAKIESFMPYLSHSATNEAFYSGRMVFFPEYSVTGLKHSGGKIGINMQEEWRYCYNPRGYSATKEDIEASYFSLESRFMFMTELTEDAELLGSFMDILFQPVYDTETGWEYGFYMANFHDDFSAEYYKTKWSNIRNDNFVFANDFATDLEVIARGLHRGTTTFDVWYPTNSSKIQQQIDDRINDLKK